MDTGGRDLATYASGAWPRVLAAGDPAPAAERLGLGYLDRKWTLEGARDRGPLRLSLPAVELADGRLVLCEATTGWRRPETLGTLADDATLSSGDRVLKLSQLRQVKNCFATRLPAGEDADLALTVASDKTVYLSHAVWG